MPSYRLALLALLPLFWVRIVQTQKTFAVCSTDDYKWTYNSKAESPCNMATELMAVCLGPSFTTWGLPPGISYWGPQQGYDTPCSCSTVTWSLYSACGTCQNRSAISWSMWTYNCSVVTVESFPLNIPQQDIIPHWTYLRVGDDGQWNETAANEDTQNPPQSHHTRVGAIVGGVIGGLAAFAVAVALFVVLYRRRHREAMNGPRSTLFEPEGASPYRPGDKTTPNLIPDPQKLYNPSDPSTYPSPLNYNRSSGVYTASPERPGEYHTVKPPLS